MYFMYYYQFAWSIPKEHKLFNWYNDTHILKGLEVNFKWENRDRKLGKKRDLKEMNSAYKILDPEEEAKKERERRETKANKLKLEIEELFGQ